MFRFTIRDVLWLINKTTRRASVACDLRLCVLGRGVFSSCLR
jgi:hypothetical protein